MRVSRRALMAVARADAAAADHATGRWVATANATVARITGLCERTVQYARATLVHLGLCRVVATGRYLTADERRTAARTHGGRQMRAASTRVLTMSCAIVCALPRRGHHYRKVKFLDGHQRTRRRVRRPATPEKKPLWLQKLAAHLDQHLPWLVRNHHIGRLCHALTALGINEHWQPAETVASASTCHAPPTSTTPWDCSSTRPETPSPTTTPMNAAWPANTTAPNSSTTNSAAAQKPPPAQPASQPSTPTPTTRPAVVNAGKPCEPHSGPPSSMSGHTDTRSYTHHETRQAT